MIMEPPTAAHPELSVESRRIEQSGHASAEQWSAPDGLLFNSPSAWTQPRLSTDQPFDDAEYDFFLHDTSRDRIPTPIVLPTLSTNTQPPLMSGSSGQVSERKPNATATTHSAAYANSPEADTEKVSYFVGESWTTGVWDNKQDDEAPISAYSHPDDIPAAAAPRTPSSVPPLTPTSALSHVSSSTSSTPALQLLPLSAQYNASLTYGNGHATYDFSRLGNMPYFPPPDLAPLDQRHKTAGGSLLGALPISQTPRLSVDPSSALRPPLSVPYTRGLQSYRFTDDGRIAALPAPLQADAAALATYREAILRDTLARKRSSLPDSYKTTISGPSGSSSSSHYDPSRVHSHSHRHSRDESTLERKTPRYQAPEKRVMACLFCRQRKIACGPGSGAAAGDKTCNQCERRQRECVYPTQSKRGSKKSMRSNSYSSQDSYSSLEGLSPRERDLEAELAARRAERARERRGKPWP